MAEHRKRGEKKQEKVEQKHRVVKQESEPVFDHFHAWEQGTPSIGETPFQPRMDEHTELLARATSDEHRANIVLHLQQTYGNRYVQRLLNSRVVQAKLNVSAPNDVYEQEADRVAKAVTRVDNAQVQRQAEEEEEPIQTKAAPEIQRQAEEEEEPIQAKVTPEIQRQAEEEEEPIQAKVTPEIQRQAEEEEEPLQTKLATEIQRQEEEEEEPIQTKLAPEMQRQEEEAEEPLQTKLAPEMQRQEEEEEEPIQTKLASGVQRQEEPEEEEEEEPVQTKLTSEVQRQEEEEELQGKTVGSQPATVHEDLETRIKAERGGGHPLSDNTREPMEKSFGADFSGVRVHTDSEADALNKQLSAKAFTTGQDVFFRQGEYSPGSDSGRELIAHELTHVVQQTGGQNQSGQIVQRELSDDELGTLGITKEQYARFNYGEKRYIEGLFREGNTGAAQEQAQAAIQTREQKLAAIRARKQRQAATTGVGEPTVPAPQPPTAMTTRPTKPAPQPPTTVTKPAEEETIQAKEPAKAPPPGAYDALVQQANYISASGGGLGGIFFLHSKQGARPEIIVKFEPGEAVRGKFAETLLAKAGLETTRSLAYPINSRKGKKIKSKVEALVGKDECHTTDPDKLVRLNQVVTNTLNKGRVVMVTDCVEALGGSVAELLMKSEDMTPEQIELRKRFGALEKLVEAFNDVDNAVDLGKMLVLDAFLGNQDRFDAANFANVMLAMRGGKWRFVLIDNEADVPTMMGEMEVKLRVASYSTGGVMAGGAAGRISDKVAVQEWVDKLIEGGPALEKGETARISFLADAQKAAKESVKKMQDEFFYTRTGHQPFKEFEPVLKAINWGQLQRGVLHGIHQGAHSILNINLKQLKKLHDEGKKSLGKSEFLSLYGLELKWKYVEMIMGEKRMKHDAAKAVLVQMASKKMKDLTGSAVFVWPEEAKLPERLSKIKTK